MISLVLKVLSYRGQPLPGNLSGVFGAKGGSVGRSSGNQLVLPDPERFISRRHGKILYRQGGYAYADTSIGGTYFVNRNLLLQRDAMLLKEGDVLRIGQYEIAVSLVAEPAARAATPGLEFGPPKSGEPTAPTHPPVGGPRPSGPDLWACFLEGADLAGHDGLADADPCLAMQSLGAMFRVFVEGTMAVLQAHPGLQAQRPAPALHATGADPLRCAADPAEALAALLVTRPGALDPAEAVRGGFGELLGHRMAAEAGLDAALGAVLKRFDPKDFAHPPGDDSEQGRARAWEAFCAAYPGLVADILEDGFDREFARVYERHMRVLRVARPR